MLFAGVCLYVAFGVMVMGYAGSLVACRLVLCDLFFVLFNLGIC